MDVFTPALAAVIANNNELELQLLYITHQLDIGHAKATALQEVCTAQRAHDGERARYCLAHAHNRAAYTKGIAKLNAANHLSGMKHEQITADHLHSLFNTVNAAVKLALSQP
jgi:hypothetical protein